VILSPEAQVEPGEAEISRLLGSASGDRMLRRFFQQTPKCRWDSKADVR
jgi:hypothetical protein